MTPAKQLIASPGKRRFSPSFDDDLDTENVDPSLLSSPTKKSKGIDGTLAKPSKFVLTDSAFCVSKSATSATSPKPFLTPVSPAQKRKAPSLSLPTTSNSTPISASRGSPKNKRVSLLSKRRTSSSPFRRIDPPSSRHGGLPFSIDAALRGTISTYTPKPEPAQPEPVMVEKQGSTLGEAMPRSWFFDIHEDTPEEEAANLMEHSACTLDISSEDDSETKRRNEELKKGKENIPPPDYLGVAAATALRVATDGNIASDSSNMPAKASKHRRQSIGPDAMVDDRSPLGDLLATDFYSEGLDASSVVIVDGTEPEKSSGLSREVRLGSEECVRIKSVVDVEKMAVGKDFVICEDADATPEVLPASGAS